ncbi:MAG TPA: hypothetical protein VHR66_11245 [Gemmataceae bacterium]|jgi:hypothetical protein|nr:hypothetical protein [Gemmataceae bacterium]
MRKISKRDREAMAKTVLIPPPGRGKIDPREIRKAIKAVIEERMQREAEAEAKAKSAGKTRARVWETE